MKHIPQPRPLQALHYSVVAVWLGTALASALDDLGAWQLAHTGAQLLATAGITERTWQVILIWSGLLADLAIGVWLLLQPGRSGYLAALLLMATMTAVATILHPALWLHPLGPLLKNLPIAAALYLLWHAHPPIESPTPKEAR